MGTMCRCVYWHYIWRDECEGLNKNAAKSPCWCVHLFAFNNYVIMIKMNLDLTHICAFYPTCTTWLACSINLLLCFLHCHCDFYLAPVSYHPIFNPPSICLTWLLMNVTILTYSMFVVKKGVHIFFFSHEGFPLLLYKYFRPVGVVMTFKPFAL